MPNNGISLSICADLAALPAARKLVVPRRHSLFSAGERAHDLYVVISGLVKRERSFNGQCCVMQIAGPACLVGDEALTGQPTYTSTATAICLLPSSANRMR